MPKATTSTEETEITELTELRRRLCDAIRETDARLTGRERRRYHRKVAVEVWKRVDLDAVRSPPQILSPHNDLCLPVVMVYRIVEGMCRRECNEAQAIDETARFAVQCLLLGMKRTGA